MGEKGRNFVLSRFSRHKIAKQFEKAAYNIMKKFSG